MFREVSFRIYESEDGSVSVEIQGKAGLRVGERVDWMVVLDCMVDIIKARLRGYERKEIRPGG